MGHVSTAGFFGIIKAIAQPHTYCQCTCNTHHIKMFDFCQHIIPLLYMQYCGHVMPKAKFKPSSNELNPTLYTPLNGSYQPQLPKDLADDIQQMEDIISQPTGKPI